MELMSTNAFNIKKTEPKMIEIEIDREEVIKKLKCISSKMVKFKFKFKSLPNANVTYVN